MISDTEVQALIAAYRKDADEFEHIEELGGQVLRDHAEKLAAALSALSGETETEWEYDAKPDWGHGIRWWGTSLDDHLANMEKYSDPRTGWWYADAGDVSDRPEVINYTVRRRRKAGPWIEVTK